jgi:hypothetical protein
MVKRLPPPGGPEMLDAVRRILFDQPRSVREYVVRQLEYDEAHRVPTASQEAKRLSLDGSR